MTTEIAKIQLRRAIGASWTSANPTLATGELGFELDTLRFKIGDGSTPWNTLAYQTAIIPTSDLNNPLAVVNDTIPLGAFQRQMMFIYGFDGAVIMTANPQILAGTVLGQELYIFGTSGSDWVQFQNGNGLKLNGNCKLINGASLYLIWDGADWAEVSRNDA